MASQLKAPTISFIDRLWTALVLISHIFTLPCSWKKKIYWFAAPIHGVRFIEYTFLMKLLSSSNFAPLDNILDISSPFLIAYELSKIGSVIKTDIIVEEEIFIKRRANLSFKKENALCLSFPSDKFDLVYSISVIEHIWKEYDKALEEIIRVTKPNGLIYLTFPVTLKYSEEWLNKDLYGQQSRSEEGKVFFSYYFDENAYKNILKLISPKTVMLCSGIYWDRKDNGFENYVSFLRNKKNSFVGTSLMQWFYGLTGIASTAGDFTNPRGTGTACLLLKKKQI